MLLVDRSYAISFFCVGSQNFHQFIDMFDSVFVLQVDAEILKRRLAIRPEDEFGGKPAEQQLVLRLHATGEGLPNDATIIDANVQLASVVDDILLRCGVLG